MTGKGNEMPDEDPVYQRKDGLWDWRIKAKNGQVIATSGGQGYTERNDAQEGYDRMKARIFMEGEETK